MIWQIVLTWKLEMVGDCVWKLIYLMGIEEIDTGNFKTTGKFYLFYLGGINHEH